VRPVGTAELCRNPARVSGRRPGLSFSAAETQAIHHARTAFAPQVSNGAGQTGIDQVPDK
jgi:hypothetical protein